jgi:hypothetical protein
MTGTVGDSLAHRRALGVLQRDKRCRKWAAKAVDHSAVNTQLSFRTVACEGGAHHEGGRQ